MRAVPDHFGVRSVGAVEQVAGEAAAERLGHRDVDDDAVAEEGTLAVAGPVEELVGDDERPGRQRLPEAADGVRRDDLVDARLLQGVDVGPVGDVRRVVLVAPSVTGQERNLGAGHLAHL